MLRRDAPGGPCPVPAAGGVIVTAVFGPLRLARLELELLCTQAGLKAAYQAFGVAVHPQGGRLPAGPPSEHVAFRMSARGLVRLSKTTPPGPPPGERLVRLLERHGQLLKHLDAWELHGGRW